MNKTAYAKPMTSTHKAKEISATRQSERQETALTEITITDGERKSLSQIEVVAARVQ